MRYTRILILALCAYLTATPWPQAQAQDHHHIVTFDAPGAGTTALQGTFTQQNINSGDIVGYYIDANGVAHGFIRSKHGSFTTFDAPGAGTASGQGTLAFGITGGASTSYRSS